MNIEILNEAAEVVKKYRKKEMVEIKKVHKEISDIVLDSEFKLENDLELDDLVSYCCDFLEEHNIPVEHSLDNLFNHHYKALHDDVKKYMKKNHDDLTLDYSENTSTFVGITGEDEELHDDLMLDEGSSIFIIRTNKVEITDLVQGFKNYSTFKEYMDFFNEFATDVGGYEGYLTLDILNGERGSLYANSYRIWRVYDEDEIAETIDEELGNLLREMIYFSSDVLKYVKEVNQLQKHIESVKANAVEGFKNNYKEALNYLIEDAKKGK